MVLKGCIYLGAFLCSLLWVQYFWFEGSFWYGCLPCLSSGCVSHYPLDRGWDWCCGDQSLHWMLGRAFSLLCGCHSPVGGRVYSPVVDIEAPWSVSELQCEMGGTGALLLGKSHSILLPRICPLGCVPCDIICHPFHALRKYTVVGITLGCSSAVGTGNWLSQFSPASTCVHL